MPSSSAPDRGTALTALLAHAGLRVTLPEKNRYLGGVCAGYEKKGFQIDFGTHLFTRGGRGPLGQVLQRVQRADEIEFLSMSNLFEMRWPDADRPGGLRLSPVALATGPATRPSPDSGDASVPTDIVSLL